MKSGCRWWRYTMNKCAIYSLVKVLKRNILLFALLIFFCSFKICSSILISIAIYVFSYVLFVCHSFVFLDFHTLGILSTTQQNGLAVPDASMYPVTSTSDVLELMSIGLQNRAVSSTALNERSSRSHRFSY